MRRAVVHRRVSTLDQTTANQQRELREVADRMGCEIVMGLQGSRHQRTKGRDRRPAWDKLCRDAARREFTESLGACERPFHRSTTLHAREIGS
jgi:DNA invertase Pin-like site-specific DNA recombinase